MCSLMKYVYFKVEFSLGRERERHQNTPLPKDEKQKAFLEHRIRSSTDVPRSLRKAEDTSSFKSVKISLLLSQNKDKRPDSKQRQ